MRTNSVLQMMAAPVASLLLVLSLLVFWGMRPVSAGVRIPIIRLRMTRANDCRDDRLVVVSLLKTGELEIGQEPVAWSQLSPQLGKFMEYRAEREVYVFADAESSYLQFADMMGKIATSSDAHIGLITGSLKRELDESYSGEFKRKLPPRHIDSCNLMWPESELRR